MATERHRKCQRWHVTDTCDDHTVRKRAAKSCGAAHALEVIRANVLQKISFLSGIQGMQEENSS